VEQIVMKLKRALALLNSLLERFYMNDGVVAYDMHMLNPLKSKSFSQDLFSNPVHQR